MSLNLVLPSVNECILRSDRLLTRYDPDKANLGTAEVYNIGSSCGKRAGLQPEHLVHAMVLQQTRSHQDTTPRTKRTHLQQSNLRHQTQRSCQRVIQDQCLDTVHLMVDEHA